MSTENDSTAAFLVEHPLPTPLELAVCEVMGATTTNKKIRSNKRDKKERPKAKRSSSSSKDALPLSAKKLEEQKLISVLEDFLLSRNSAASSSAATKSSFLDNQEWLAECFIHEGISSEEEHETTQVDGTDGVDVTIEVDVVNETIEVDAVTETIEEVVKLKKRKRTVSYSSSRLNSKIKPRAKRIKTERKQQEEVEPRNVTTKDDLETKTDSPTESAARVAPTSKKRRRRNVNLNGRIRSRKPKVGRKRKVPQVSAEEQNAVTEELETEQPASGDTSLPSTSNGCKREVDTKYDKVCQICEKGSSITDLIRCEGGCMGLFHSTCVTYEPEKTFRCQECSSGKRTCFVCKRSEGEVRRCSIRVCGKFYHLECVQSYRSARIDTTTGKLICPQHACLSCALVNCKIRMRSRLYRCNRCPVAYHPNDVCIAAGSRILSSNVIVCPVHYRPKDRLKTSQINVNWCFVCSQGGSLICCETCPASFHAECLNIEPPEGSYYCVECTTKTQPKYGDIVWVKLGNYRWWPAKVCNPKNVPTNIQTIPHVLGEFPVQFFGTYDYYWTRRSRMFQFLEGDHRTHASNSNRLAQTFKIALEEALVAFQKWKSVKDTRDAYNYEKHNLKPPPYKFIKANKPVGKVATMSAVDNSQATVCDCNPKSENPCGSDSECLNRLLMFECDPATCPAGERCQNQRFKMLQYVNSEIFRAEGKGWGLKSLEDIKKGQFVNEYVGEIIDEEECRSRMKKRQEENDSNYYFLTIDKDRIIDAGRKGNLSRFMNHSCQPNCELHKWTVKGDTRVGLFAVCDIPSGTELTFNYNLDCLGNDKTTCCCNAPNCSGFIGERPKTVVVTPQGPKKGPTKQRRKRSKFVKTHHEDECFRCGLDGQLLLCDRKNCTKGYHLGCVHMEKLPHGKWECPWHHCDSCGKSASALCSACPTSYCDDHNLETNIKSLSDGTLLCNEHMAEQIVSLSDLDKEDLIAGTINTTETTCNEQRNTDVQASISSQEISEQNGTSPSSEQPMNSVASEPAIIKRETLVNSQEKPQNERLSGELVKNGSWLLETNGHIKMTTANHIIRKTDDLRVVVEQCPSSLTGTVPVEKGRAKARGSRVEKRSTALRVQVERSGSVLTVKKRARGRPASKNGPRLAKNGRCPAATNGPNIVSDPSPPLPLIVTSNDILI